MPLPIAQYQPRGASPRFLRGKLPLLTTPASPKQQKGAGLIEVLIASVIFLFSLTGLSRLTITTIQTNALAKHFSTATSLAEQQLESLRNQDFLALASGADPLNPLTGAATTGGTYTRTWTVVDDSPTAMIKTVKVAVEWTDKSGNHVVNLPSVIGR